MPLPESAGTSVILPSSPNAGGPALSFSAAELALIREPSLRLWLDGRSVVSPAPIRLIDRVAGMPFLRSNSAFPPLVVPDTLAGYGAIGFNAATQGLRGYFTLPQSYWMVAVMIDDGGDPASTQVIASHDDGTGSAATFFYFGSPVNLSLQHAGHWTLSSGTVSEHISVGDPHILWGCYNADDLTGAIGIDDDAPVVTGTALAAPKDASVFAVGTWQPGSATVGRLLMLLVGEGPFFGSTDDNARRASILSNVRDHFGL